MRAKLLWLAAALIIAPSPAAVAAKAKSQTETTRAACRHHWDRAIPPHTTAVGRARRTQELDCIQGGKRR